MTNEEKAREIQRETGTLEDAALMMAEWKDEQMIEKAEQMIKKAVEWLNDWLTDDSCQCGIPITKTERENFLNDFKQSIMEE